MGREHRGSGGSGQRRLDSRGNGKVGGLGLVGWDIWGDEGLMGTESVTQRRMVSRDLGHMSGGLGISDLGVWKHTGQFRIFG